MGYLDIAGLRQAWSCVKSYVQGYAAQKSHTHSYAGSSSAGGSAASAVKLDTSAGTATKPVYFSSGKPVACTYTLGASVPSGAKFTDTTYGLATASAAGLMSADDKSSLSLIKSPTVLYTSTTGIYASATSTWKYTAVSGLSSWKEVRMWIEVGDATRGYHIFTRDYNAVCVNGYYSAAYNGTMRVICDFANNRVGVYVASMTGWRYYNLMVLRVEGLVKNS